jgi:hypothetical protein
MMKPVHPEVGRELSVSDLKPPQIVWVQKMGGKRGNSCATMWVTVVTSETVGFWAGETKVAFIATRIGANLEQVTDDSNGTMRMYEYLGKP